jgi:limonene-1,2-epoxide hydrolase
VQAVDRLVAYFESLTPARVQEMGEYYAADAFFKDPFHEVRGLAQIQAIFARMFDQVDAPRFHVLSRVFDGAEGFLVWHLEFHLRSGKPARIHGLSHFKLAQDGRVAYHRDYWDTAEELYEKVPVLGSFMRWMKRCVG